MKDEVAKDQYRLKYHFMAPAYWINDPNGLIYFSGEYHMFYQHNPYAPKWGIMHWGHAKSKDLVHWEHLPVALAPSEDYDLDKRGGCFSGSAVDDNGTLAIVYTGAVIRDSKLIHSQCLATSTDGIIFEKYEGNPVISVPPEEGSVDFRDPRVWKHDDKWYLVIGSCKDGKGKALLYCSDNLRKWDYKGVLAESDGSMGTMWECPDFFPLGDKYVLVFSPMGIGEKKAFYLVGDMDYKTAKFTWDIIGEVDYGFDYYITQTFLDGKGRRIMIGWLNTCYWMPWWKSFSTTVTKKWCGAMSIPRIVELDDDMRLRFQPLEELKVLRGDHFRLENIEIIPGMRVLPEEEGDKCLEIMAEFELKGCKAKELGFSLRCSVDESEVTEVSYNIKAGELCFDRRRSDSGSESLKTCKLESAGGKTLKLHIFVDTSYVEIFADKGLACMTNNIYPQSEITDIDLFTRGGKVKLMSLDLWKLKSIW
ncbi:MAG: glycoside hydrolase family 32 protein [Actinobacteria bacterium]|nr:glycoside hydrolase family 32 protein [Actinomycetota bacterium]